MSAIGLDLINDLTGGRIGTFDVACPLCGPEKRAPANRRRKVLRIWRNDERFATYHCARCGDHGYARNWTAPAPDPVKLAKARAEAAEAQRRAAAERLRVARWLWSQRAPIEGSIAERYLRHARGCQGRLPPTLGFLAGDRYPPALIAAFGIAHEIEAGEIAIDDSAVRGVHLTKLLPDGSWRLHDADAKIMIGHSVGSPIVLSAMNDGLALGITEGIEDGLSVAQTRGTGVWVAGSASRLPALADAVPTYTEVVTIFAHADTDGQRHAAELARRLSARSIEVSVVTLSAQKKAA